MAKRIQGFRERRLWTHEAVKALESRLETSLLGCLRKSDRVGMTFISIGFCWHANLRCGINKN
jgi:hypothetical protein